MISVNICKHAIQYACLLSHISKGHFFSNFLIMKMIVCYILEITMNKVGMMIFYFNSKNFLFGFYIV